MASLGLPASSLEVNDDDPTMSNDKLAPASARTHDGFTMGRAQTHFNVVMAEKQPPASAFRLAQEKRRCNHTLLR